MTSWKEERCAERPEELQKIGDGIYLQRREIKKVTHEADETAGRDAYEEWTCECREITESEYELLAAVQEIDSQKAIDDYTEQLIEEGLL